MKVLTAIVATLALVGANAANQCYNLCGTGSSSCQTKSEAAYCNAGFQLSASNKCVACGRTTSPVGLGWGTGIVGAAVGNGQWWEPWNAGACTVCVTNCETCTSKTTCTACKARFHRASATSCVACPANCAICSSTTTCTTCDATWRVNGNSGCQKCTQSNCNTCQSDVAKCDTNGCATGYVRAQAGNCVACVPGNAGVWWSATENTNAGNCVSPCTAGCAACTAKDKCGTCANGDTTKKTGGYFRDTKTSTCTGCTAASCAKCVGKASECDGAAGNQGSCWDGFLLATDKTCVACVKSAGNNFTPGTKTCKQCSANCNACTSDTACNSCNGGFVLDGNNKCQTCDVAGCKTCTLANRTGAGKKCKVCKNSYFASATTVEFAECYQCDANCVTCTSAFQCGACKTGYQIAQNGKCVVCNGDGNCAASTIMTPALGSTGTCNSMPLATVRDKTLDAKVTTIWNKFSETHCISCTTGCANCVADAKGAGQCKSCLGPYWPYNLAGAAMTNQNSVDPTKCTACTPNCATCATKNTCTTCKSGSTSGKTPGYYKDTKTNPNTCPNQCTPNCAKCTTNDKVDCDNASCYSGYALTQKKTCLACSSDQQTKEGMFFDAAGNTGAGSCTNCVTSCKECSAKLTCKTCKTGHRLVGNNKCDACTVSSCDACANDVAKCTACSTGFAKSADGTCTACSGQGKHWNSNGKGTCSTCDANCAAGGCTSATACGTNSCMSGYYTDANGKCLACGVANCSVCSSGTATTLCTSCKSKYFISADKKSCSIMCDAHATGCKDGWQATSCDVAKQYYLSNYGRCVYCAVPANVGNTGQDNTKTGNKIFWTGKACTICDPNANGCSAASFSTTCVTGYENNNGICTKKCTLPQVSIGGKGKCFSCGSNVVAGRCYTEYEGLECSKGYHIQGAGAGNCCKDTDNSGAVGVFGGLSIIAGAVAAAFALLH